MSKKLENITKATQEIYELLPKFVEMRSDEYNKTHNYNPYKNILNSLRNFISIRERISGVEYQYTNDERDFYTYVINTLSTECEEIFETMKSCKNEEHFDTGLYLSLSVLFNELSNIIQRLEYQFDNNECQFNKNQQLDKELNNAKKLHDKLQEIIEKFNYKCKIVAGNKALKKICQLPGISFHVKNKPIKLGYIGKYDTCALYQNHDLPTDMIQIEPLEITDSARPVGLYIVD